MAPPVQGRKPYVRPMQGWWRRDPYFTRYLAREMTSLAIGLYALILCVGLIRLAQGEAAFNGWLNALRSPLPLLLHAVILLAMLLHAQSWFQIMPKTMPALRLGGKRVAERTVTCIGWLVAGATNAALLWLAWWWLR